MQHEKRGSKHLHFIKLELVEYTAEMENCLEFRIHDLHARRSKLHMLIYFCDR